MSVRKVPIIPTIIVVAAACVMVALGIWQLGRADEKEALIAEFESASERGPVRIGDQDLDNYLYRTVEFACPEPTSWSAIAGRNRAGRTGYSQQFTCRERTDWGQPDVAITPAIYAVVGWSPGPNEPDWSGGNITGVLTQLGDDYRITLAEPVQGLEASAAPDPSDMPNNHLAYAGQWFFFALTALLIYGLALRRRWRDA
ncbi:SURF1 family cytochrome oxidase biogenesis protein [Aurantiacibacter sp. MUD61]|uniref:SURF1 family cytochrome oxidase biogenesis protein n=1 Tax=Aurantiacibacter sp. MUD61 TaxID=3009083 RepID=UPI0022F0137F|nr:SURF1 family cytochrome oxidase biogenesis protein [Aurantiacibacter sp. MUD61]